MAAPNDGNDLVAAHERLSDNGGRNVTYIYNNVGRVENGNFAENHGGIAQNSRASANGCFDGVHRQEGTIERRVMFSWLQDDIVTLLNPILDASHTRNRRVSPPNSACFRGTRQSVLQDVHTWATSSLGAPGSPHIMWIYGYAGCGKSAIAQAVADHFAATGQLAASFFFFRGSGDRGNSSRFATTIASQVASTVWGTASKVKAAVKNNRGLLSTTTATLTAQFQHLIYEPINAWTLGWIIAWLRGRPYLIVLDGLDECRNREDIAEFIEQMINFFAERPTIPLRFLITSRVESHIHQRLHSSEQVQLLNLPDHTSNSDIAAALDAALEHEKGRRDLACDKAWPSAEDREKLVKHIDGSYIFMTTIVKLLFDPHAMNRLSPMERLPLILSTQPDFDGLYRSILEPARTLPHFHDIINVIALAQEELSIAQISELLNIKTGEVVNVLINLHAIMQIPGDDFTPVTLWHTSLRDFLCTGSRSGMLSANLRSHAYACLSSLYRSTSPASLPNSGYSSRFASFHWTEYIGKTRSEERGDPAVEQEITDFLKIYSETLQEGCTLLESAVHSQSWTVVLDLMNANANVNVRFQRFERGIVCPLHAACNYEQWDLVYLLLERGANPNVISSNKYGSGFNYGTPLAFAAEIGDVELVTRLLECGADPNLQGGWLGTALLAACYGGSLEIVELLLDHGADPNLRGAHQTEAPLHTCAMLGDKDFVQALLMRNADPNIQDKNGNTPLHRACRRESIAVVECLLKFKLDAGIRNKEGQTALQVAHMRGKQGVVEALGSHGIQE